MADSSGTSTLPHGPEGLPERIRGLDRCLIMGILNVTPDSFSDGGRWDSPDAAVSRGRTLAGLGADIVDVGGESTRPGASRTGAEEERNRVLPVVRELAGDGLFVSVDTMRSATAAAAVAAGAGMVNDVSGGSADPDMFSVIADLSVPLVIMHRRGDSATMDRRAAYRDAVSDVIAELGARVEAAVDHGIEPSRIVVDPGLGFSKRAEHNWALLAGLSRIRSWGFPVLVGASRKRFLADLPAGEPLPVDNRDAATAAISALAAANGAWCVRVHEVVGSLDAVRVARAWLRGGAAGDAGGGVPGRQVWT